MTTDEVLRLHLPDSLRVPTAVHDKLVAIANTRSVLVDEALAGALDTYDFVREIHSQGIELLAPRSAPNEPTLRIITPYELYRHSIFDSHWNINRLLEHRTQKRAHLRPPIPTADLTLPASLMCRVFEFGEQLGVSMTEAVRRVVLAEERIISHVSREHLVLGVRESHRRAEYFTFRFHPQDQQLGWRGGHAADGTPDRSIAPTTAHMTSEPLLNHGWNELDRRPMFSVFVNGPASQLDQRIAQLHQPYQPATRVVDADEQAQLQQLAAALGRPGEPTVMPTRGFELELTLE